jgi:Prophage antirepressor
MKNQLQVFENKDFGKLEILMMEDKPYFPATDCATILGYSNPRKAIIDHCLGVTKRDSLTNGGKQGKNYIPEGDLYRLIIRSKLPAAVKFERWVFDEVLPSIRKHGAYVTDEVLEAAIKSQDFAFDLFQKLLTEKGRNIALQGEVTALTPKAQYCDVILQCKNTVPVSIIAKDYGYSAVVFNRLLHDLRIQYKMSGTWLLYQRFAGQGYTQSRTYYTADRIAVVHTHWTQKGRMFLYNTLRREGILPIIEHVEALEDYLDSFDDFDFDFDDDFELDLDLDFYDEYEDEFGYGEAY